VLIGVAMVLDTLDGFFARLTRSTSAFGVELDSLADVVSFGLGPAILAFTWGLWPLERLGWAAGFLYVTAAAMRLARFNVQSSTTTASTDKRYFVGMPSPAAASVIASTVYLYPYGLQERQAALPALAMVLVPAFLMVSTIRFRSVKAIDVGWRRSYFALFLGAVALALVASHPRLALVVLSYAYTVTALVVWGYTRLRRRPAEQLSTRRNHSEGLRPSDSLARSLARRFDGALRSRGSLAVARSRCRYLCKRVHLSNEIAVRPVFVRRTTPSSRLSSILRFFDSFVNRRYVQFDSDRHRYTATGSRTTTVVPRPLPLSISICPPFNSMLRRAIGNPRPVPVVLVEKYGSKTRDKDSSSIPTPVSCTRNATK
jgi:CDP-diacylglycerol--serine O-phosphatidyltransferase